MLCFMLILICDHLYFLRFDFYGKKHVPIRNVERCLAKAIMKRLFLVLTTVWCGEFGNQFTDCP